MMEKKEEEESVSEIILNLCRHIDAVSKLIVKEIEKDTQRNFGPERLSRIAEELKAANEEMEITGALAMQRASAENELRVAAEKVFRLQLEIYGLLCD